MYGKCLFKRDNIIVFAPYNEGWALDTLKNILKSLYIDECEVLCRGDHTFRSAGLGESLGIEIIDENKFIEMLQSD